MKIFGKDLAIATGTALLAVNFILFEKTQAAILTTFEDAMQPVTPTLGWSYLWNRNGPIGNPANYTPLLATTDPTFFYDTNGVAGLPDPFPGSSLFLGKAGSRAIGHPGEGGSFAIAAYTLSASGLITITDGLLTNIDTSTDGLVLQIYLNSTLVRSDFTAAGLNSSVRFTDINLGNLNAGDTIYVAIGDRGNDSFDAFALQYAIADVSNPPQTVPETSSRLGILAIGILGGGIFLKQRQLKQKH